MARSSAFVANTNATAAAVNLLRDDALGAAALLANQQGTPGMTVQVQPGTYYIGGAHIVYAGGNTSTITAPTTHPRIDLITLDSSGTLAVVTGTEASSPVAPTYPGNKLVIATIYNVVGETIIYDNANQTAGQGYLTDVRPFLNNPMPSQTDNSSTLAFNTVYNNTSGRPQLHIVHVSMTLNASSDSVIVSATRTGGYRAQIYRQNVHTGLTSDTTIMPIMFIVDPGDGFQLESGVTGSATVSIDTWITVTL
jgi:hypothetical protein